VVGLACGRALAGERGPRRARGRGAGGGAEAIGTATSSRNSEVIHAGIYHPQGSLKARLCLRGRELLYAYCAERALPHRRSGKLIVATAADQEAELLALQAAGRANGVGDLQLLTQAQAQALEPQLACTAALLSPSTGIVDSHALMLSLRGDFEDRGHGGLRGAGDGRAVCGRWHHARCGR
jgi:L-2-hydroxyglutarate oxidase LhgO